MEKITISRWGPVRRLPTSIEMDLMMYNPNPNIKIAMMQLDIAFISPQMSNPRLENIDSVFAGYKSVIGELEILDSSRSAPFDFYYMQEGKYPMVRGEEDVERAKTKINLITQGIDVPVVPQNQFIYPFAVLKFDWQEGKYPIGWGVDSSNSFLVLMELGQVQIFI